MTGQDLPSAIRYIPLLPRPRPPALPPRQRLAELQNLLHKATSARDAEDGLTRACEVMNKAALTASDTGQHALAETLCWQQYKAFASAAPLTAKTGTFALQPLVNLGRLAIRTGQPTTAHGVFESLLAAATHGHPAQVRGRSCSVAELVTSSGERDELRRFLWAVLLADGTRALCLADRWQDALAHLQRHNGIGRRLLDGRQVAVAAALHRREPDAARELLADASCSEPWEKGVAACLTTAITRMADQDPTDAIDTMVQLFTELPLAPGGSVFAVRLGTLACELAPCHRALVSHVIDAAMGNGDAHAAAVLLDSLVVETELSPRQRETLRGRIDRAELVGAAPPASLADDLAAICDRAASHLTRHLRQMRTAVVVACGGWGGVVQHGPGGDVGAVGSV